MSKKLRKEHKINGEISANELRITDEGIMSLNDALALAESREMDLVMLNELAQPPVCRIMNYEKHIYDLNKKQKVKTLDVKEIKLSLNIGNNDLVFKKRHAIEFLKKGHRVKISLRLKGREAIYQNKGKEITLKFVVDIENFGFAEDMPKIEGKVITIFIKPLAKK